MSGVEQRRGSGGDARLAVRRSSMRKRIAIIVAIATSIAPAAVAERFELADGRFVELIPVPSMSCRQLAGKLAEIDETGYRGASPEPRHSADRRLFEYEKQVYIRYYTECAAARAGAKPTTVFRGGFDAGDDD